MNALPADRTDSVIELADALDWLARQERGTARAIIYDPPYSRYSPMRGAYIASISGLREQAHLTWCRNCPGGGGLFRGACDPVLIASRTPPDRVDKAAVKNWVVADYEIPRAHPYSKPPEVIEYVLARVCRRGDLVLDPFAGSGSSRVAAEKLGLDLVWRGCDIDPQFAEATASATASTPVTA
jgi:hypothetical protein